MILKARLLVESPKNTDAAVDDKDAAKEDGLEENDELAVLRLADAVVVAAAEFELVLMRIGL